jgi:3-carboxy-cis,cis-muconate cycloisomerase
MITASLGMIGADLMLLAQGDVGEIGFEGAGGSSTLPQKQNPVIAEILVALARFAAHQVGALHQAAIHPTERDGAAWTLEWLALPPLIQATGAALRQAEAALGGLRVDTARMRANLDATRGLVLAEAASFVLAAAMPRADAAARVREAVAAVVSGAAPHLLDALAAAGDASIDWEALRDGRAGLEPADLLIARVLAEAEAMVGAAP